MIGASLICVGCGAPHPWRAAEPWRCPRVRMSHDHDDTDHVLQRRIDAPLALPGDPQAACDSDEPLPFVRFRQRLFAYHRARAIGIDDADFIALVRTLDARVAAIAGTGFRVTPLRPSPSLAKQLGLPSGSTLWCKDESENVSGSHKGRHLFGLLLEILVDEALTSGQTLSAVLDERADRGRPLAIASCGNAALAAAVLARACGRRLLVFIPPTAEDSTQARLRALGADVTICTRADPQRDPAQHSPAGDPTYHAFQAAVTAGALPFCCQGPENGLTIQGAHTIVYELLDALGPRRQRLRHLFVQVGGGALLSAVVAALSEAVQSGVLSTLPRVYAVQTSAVAPLFRAYQRILAEISKALPAADRPAIAPSFFPRWAKLLAQPVHLPTVLQVLHFARQHRHAFMWPWTTVGEPHSLARGILDDETYDWACALQGMLSSAGYPVLASEAALARAHAAAKQAGFPRVCATGSAGLAGLLTLMQEDALSYEISDGEDVAVLLTGSER